MAGTWKTFRDFLASRLSGKQEQPKQEEIAVAPAPEVPDRQDFKDMQLSLEQQANALYNSGQAEAALPIYLEQEEICRALGLQDDLQRCLGNQGLVQKARNDPEAAQRLYEEQAAICRVYGYEKSLTGCLGQLAGLYRQLKKPQTAIEAYEEQESLLREQNNPDALQICLCEQANIYFDFRLDLDKALNLYSQTETICRENNLPRGLQVSLGNQALVHKTRGDTKLALEKYREQAGVLRELGNSPVLISCLESLSILKHNSGDPEGAFPLYQELARLCREAGDKRTLQACLGNQVLVFKHRKDWNTALELLRERISLCQESGDNETAIACVIDQENIEKILQQGDQPSEGTPVTAPGTPTPSDEERFPPVDLSHRDETIHRIEPMRKDTAIPEGLPLSARDLWKEWTEPYDLFISYARKDNEDGMVTALVEVIQSDFAGFSPSVPLKVFFDKDVIKDMQDWRNRLQKGLRQSKVLLAVLSKAYFQSEWCRREWEEYIQVEQGRLYPGEALAPIFIVAPEELGKVIPPSAKDWWDNMTNRQAITAIHPYWPKGRQALQEQLVHERMRQLQQNIRERVQHGQLMAKVPRNIRGRNANFVGRSQELTRLRDELSRFEMVGICAVNGVAGIGKSSVAREYAFLFRREYLGGQFEIDLSNINTIAGVQDQLVRIARDYLKADIPREIPQAEQHERAKAAFEQLSEKVLLILDNLNEESTNLIGAANRGKLPSAEKVHLLITTRADPRSLGGIATIALDILPPADALDLLFRFREFARRQDDPAYLRAREGKSPLSPGGRGTGGEGEDAQLEDLPPDEEWKAALAIVNRLGRHALAVSLVAAYLGNYPKISYIQFAQDLAKRGIGLALEKAGSDEKVRSLIQHPETLISPLFERSVAQLSPLVLRTLEYAAFLPADQVPIAWLKQLVSRDGEMADALQEKPFESPPWEETVHTLERLQYLVGEPFARMHRVLQEVVRRRMSPAQQSRLAAAIQGQLQSVAVEAEKKWTQRGARRDIRPLVTLALDLVTQNDPTAQRLASQVLPTAAIVARVNLGTGNYDLALREFRQIEKLAKGANDNKQLAFALLQQAKILDQCKSSGALAMYERAEALYRTLEEPDPLQACLLSRANILYSRQEYAEALRLYQEHESVCRQYQLWQPLQAALFDRGAAHFACNELETALELFEEHASVCKEAGLSDGLQRALGSQAVIHRRQNNFDHALELLDEQEAVCRNSDNRVGLQFSLHQRAEILMTCPEPDIERALELLKEEEELCHELKNWDALQGCLHSQAWGLLNLREDPEGALELWKEQMRICKQHNLKLGLEVALRSRAVAYKALGRAKEALEELTVHEAVCRDLGLHDLAQRSLYEQAGLLFNAGKYDEALAKYHEQEKICREHNLPAGLQGTLDGQALIHHTRQKWDAILTLAPELEKLCHDLKLDTGLHRLLYFQAGAYRGLGELERALALFRRLEEIGSKEPPDTLRAGCLNDHAALEQQMGNLSAALALYEQAIELARVLNDAATLPWRLLNVGSILKGLKRMSDSEAAFEEADQLFAEQEESARLDLNFTAAVNFGHARGEVARLREQWDTALAHYNAVIEQDPNNMPFTYRMRGQVRAKKGDLPGAIRDYSAAIERARKAGLSYMSILLDRAWAYFEASRDEEARRDFQSIVEAQPSPEILSEFGNFLVNIGQFQEALVPLDRAVALSPAWSSVYEGRALARCYHCDFAGALADATKAIQLNPKVANYYDLRAWIRVRGGAGDWEAAAADCRQAIAIDPGHKYVYSNLALACRGLGQAPLATEALHHLLDIHLAKPPEKAGRTRSSRIAWNAVAEDWSAAIGGQPDGMAYLGRGIAHWLAGKLNAAVTDLEQALSLDLANRGDAEQVLTMARKESQKN